MLSYLLFPPFGVNRAALKDPTLFKPRNVRGWVEFPERLERWLRPFDDAIIAWAQRWLHPVLIVVSRLFAVIYSVEIAAMIPFFLIFIGWEREAMLAMCHLTVLLVLTQLPKRFMWRYRPYMKSRAKMLTDDKTSSFPARTVACGVVFTYLAVQLGNLRIHGGVSSGTFAIFAALAVAVAVVITSAARVVVGAHYPSDCVVGAAVGGFCCLCGEVIYYRVGCTPLALENSAFWSWENFDYHPSLAWMVTGLAIVLIGAMKALLLWAKLPMIAGLLFPSLALSHVLCPVAVDDRVFHLAHAELRYQQFVLLTAIIVAILFAYEYLRPKRPHVNCCFYAVTHCVLFLLLLLQRLAPSSTDDSAVRETQLTNGTVT